MKSLPISQHAKERACQRYGVVFSQRQWRGFIQTLDSQRAAIRLRDDRWACYFERSWYLVVRTEDGVVLTFLALEDATPEDKAVLRNADSYLRINVDAFNVGLAASATMAGEAVCSGRKKVPLPPEQSYDAELPDALRDALRDIAPYPQKRSPRLARAKKREQL